MPITSRSFVRSQILFFVVGVIALATIVGVAIWLGNRSAALSEEILAARDLKTTAVELQAAIQRTEASQRGFLFTSNEVYLAPYGQAKTAAVRSIEALPTRLTPYPALGPAAARLAEVVEAKFTEMDDGISLTRQRDSAGALDLVLTNRGKALMDEANVYITGVVLAADGQLSTLVAEQASNAASQRLTAIIGALFAISAAAAALWTIIRYAADLGRARDALCNANTELEAKVEARTAELARSNDEMRAARDRAEMLIHEVNHRVANSLAMVSSLVGLQAHATSDEAAKSALTETQSRIQAIAMVHKRLYSAGDVEEVSPDEYLTSVLEQVQSTLNTGDRVALRYDFEPLRLKTDASINLGVVAAEWVMNAAKYAYPQGAGEVRVTLTRQPDGRAVLAVDDDGIGRDGGPAKGTGLGSRIVSAMARSLRADVEYADRRPGLSARPSFPLEAV